MLDKIRFLPLTLLRKVGIAKFLNYRLPKKLNHTTMMIPVLGGELEALLRMQLGFKTALLASLKHHANVDYFVDVGANYGQSLVEIYLFNNKVKYYGFEPNPDAFYLLKKLVAANNIDAMLFPWACGSTALPKQLFASSALDSAATIVPQIRPNTYENVTGAWVATYPLDWLREHLVLPPKFVLKIDVEGAENEVIKGALDTIKAQRPFILCEVLHAHRKTEITHNNQQKTQLMTLLQELGYVVYLCELDPAQPERLLGLKKVNAFQKNQLWRDAPHTCDFLFVPDELSF